MEVNTKEYVTDKDTIQKYSVLMAELISYLLKNHGTIEYKEFWFTDLSVKIFERYPDNIVDYASIHKCLLILDGLRTDSDLFSVIAGHYLCSEREFMHFLSLDTCETHVYIVKRLKNLEYSWSLLDVSKCTNSHYLENIVYPLDMSLYDNINNITYMLKDIKILFCGRYITIAEYNMYRLLHTSDIKFLDIESVISILDVMSHLEFDLKTMIYSTLVNSANVNRDIKALVEENIFK